MTMFASGKPTSSVPPSRERAPRGYRGKRLLDLTIAVPGLIVLAPAMGLVALALRFTLGRPVLFRQLRPGLHGTPFVVLKFRTMSDARDGTGQLLREEQRLTRFGHLLRVLSIDELPQLINVIRGEMSLVGPRPLLMEYLERYTPEQARRHNVWPGISGWAQIHGRQGLPFSRRLAMDAWYVDHCSLGLDLKILALTVMHLVKGEGVRPGQDLARDFDDVGLTGSPRGRANGVPS